MKRKWSASQEQVANEWKQVIREGKEFYPDSEECPADAGEVIVDR